MYLKSNVVWKAYTEEKQTIHGSPYNFGGDVKKIRQK